MRAIGHLLMRGIGLAGLVTLAVALSACATDHCKERTLFLTYTLVGDAQSADAIDVTLAIDGSVPQTMRVPRHLRDSTIEVDFANYPKGQVLTLTLATVAGVPASGSQTVTASPRCTTIAFTLDPKSLGADLGSDLSTADLQAPADLQPPADLQLVIGPSCKSLATGCGPSGTENCCDSPIVSGGTFDRSYDVAADHAYPTNTYPATINDFRLDKFEVTVGRFRKLVATGMGTRLKPPATGSGENPSVAFSGWDSGFNASLTADPSALTLALKCDATHQTWTDSAGTNESRPINCVTWFEAFAFCVWDGGFLPTEAEWNYAAAGGSEQRAFPWSNPPGSLAIDNGYAVYNCGGATCTGVGDIFNVGSLSTKGDGKWLQSDLAGNVSEWVLDWFDPALRNPCNDCAYLQSTLYRVRRGSSYNLGDAYQRVSNRNEEFPDRRTVTLGFRCARSL